MEDFSDVIGDGDSMESVRGLGVKDFVNIMDKNGRIWMDFRKYDYYLGFTMLQCSCDNVPGIQYRVRVGYF